MDKINIPVDIAQKAVEFQTANEIALNAFKVVSAWLKENTDVDGVYIEDIYIADNPTGTEQDDGEYCDQTSCGYCEDSFSGTYYHPIDRSKKYLAYKYEC